MRRLQTFLTIAAFALVALPISARAQAEKKTDLTGKWLFTVTSDVGTGTPTVTFKQTGDSLSGHYSSQTFGEVDFKGTFKDQKIVFTINATADGNAFAVTYSGTMDGADAMKGTVDFAGMASGTFSSKRQPAGGTGK
jgi:hypothetical protein